MEERKERESKKYKLRKEGSTFEMKKRRKATQEIDTRAVRDSKVNFMPAGFSPFFSPAQKMYCLVASFLFYIEEGA